MPLAAGQPFPDLELPCLGGAPRRLMRAAGGGPVLFAVAHADCATSRLALPFVERLHQRRSPRAAVVAVLQEDAAGAGALAGELALSLPIALDRAPYAAGRRLRLESVPTLYLVGPEGRVLAVHEGFRREAFESLAKALGVALPFFTAQDAAPALRPG
jgi:hypothetical protein